MSFHRMCALASEIATLERKYRALDHKMSRARAKWDRPKYERSDAEQQALRSSKAAVHELAELMQTWGISFEDLAMLGINNKTITEVCNAFEGWEVGRDDADEKQRRVEI